MAKAEERLEETKKNVMQTVTDLMNILKEQKKKLDAKEEELKSYEKDLVDRENRIEKEIQGFSTDVEKLVKQNEKFF